MSSLVIIPVRCHPSTCVSTVVTLLVCSVHKQSPGDRTPVQQINKRLAFVHRAESKGYYIDISPQLLIYLYMYLSLEREYTTKYILNINCFAHWSVTKANVSLSAISYLMVFHPSVCWLQTITMIKGESQNFFILFLGNNYLKSSPNSKSKVSFEICWF